MSDGNPSNTLKMWIIAAVVVLVLGTVLLFLQWQMIGHITYDQTDTELRCVHDDQCERPGARKLLAEGQNTFSNLAYLLFGLCAIVRAGRYGAPMHSRPGMLLFGLSLCFLAVCSGYYHATLNFDGTRTADGELRSFLEKDMLTCKPAPDHSEVPQLLDIVGVYAALIALFLFGLESALKKEMGEATVGAKVAGAIFGVGVPLVAVVFFSIAHGDAGQGGAGAGLLFALLLAIPAGFTITRYSAGIGESARAWLMWAIWVVCVAATAGVAYVIKPDLHWDSNYVFGVMMVLLIAVLGVNWSFSNNQVPWPEVVILGIVFLLGIGPRLLDGYDTAGVPQAVFRKDLCSPNGILQAHALWHVMSALALALTFDLMEKSRPVYESAPSTILLPQTGELSEMLSSPIANQSAVAIIIKIVASTASVLFAIVIVANHEHSWLGWPLAGAAIALSALLWFWPLFARRS